MDKEKEIYEMAKAVFPTIADESDKFLAEFLKCNSYGIVLERVYTAGYRKADDVRKETINALRKEVMKTLKECSFEPYISAGVKATKMQCYEACVQKFESMFDGVEV